MKTFCLKLLQRQQGAATMIVVAVLAIAMALVALTIANTGLMEQRISGNDLRAREAQEAAEAGLDYGIAWASKNNVGITAPCPKDGCRITGSSTGENYNYTVTYAKKTTWIEVISLSNGASDTNISARSTAFIKQIPKALFGSSATMPPPWVIKGCMDKTAKGNPNLLLLSAQSKAILLGGLAGVNLDTLANASLLSPEQLLAATLKLCLDVDLLGIHLGVNLAADADVLNKTNGGKSSADLDTAIKLDQSKNTDHFQCDKNNDAHCAWNEIFKLDLDATVEVADLAGNIFKNTNQDEDKIPCGPAALSSSVYVVEKTNAITSADIKGDCGKERMEPSKIPGCVNIVGNKTIGSCEKPVVIIIRKSAGCPGFSGGVNIYGIIYYEDDGKGDKQEACKVNGWGNAKIFGSVIWENSIEKPNANTEFHEISYKKGSLNDVFNIGVDDAVRLPGTWKDF